MSAEKRIDHADTFDWLWRTLAPAGAPQPTREYQFAKPRRFRFDFAFVRQCVAVEVDGGQWLRFGGRHSTDGDREKLNLAAQMGWRVLRYSPQMLDDYPKAVIEQVCMTLRES